VYKPQRTEGEQSYSSTLSLTSAIDGVGVQCHAPAALTPGKTWYSMYRRLGGSQGQSGWVQKISPPLGFHPQTVQPAASCYTDYAILAHNLRVMTKVNDKHNLRVIKMYIP